MITELMSNFMQTYTVRFNSHRNVKQIERAAFNSKTVRTKQSLNVWFPRAEPSIGHLHLLSQIAGAAAESWPP